MRLWLLLFSLLVTPMVNAGVDLTGKIDRIWLNGDKLWLRMDTTAFDSYCKKGWYGFNLYIKTSDPNYPYYYSLIASAQVNNQGLYIANISVFDGSTYCDLTATGYGIVVYKPIN